MVSTPNRITFSPGRDTPINPFHTRELNADELTQLLVDARFRRGVDERGVPWTAAGGDGRPPRRLDHRRADRACGRRRAVAAPSCWPMSPRSPRDDFDMVEGGDRRDVDIDDSLDLVAIAVRP